MTLLGGVALLEEVCHCGGGLRGLMYGQVTPSVESLLLAATDQYGELSTPFPAPCLPGCCHASHHAMLPIVMIMDYTSETVSQSQLKLSL